MDILHKVREEIASTLKVPLDTIGPETGTDNLPAWDSLGHVNIMMSLEQAFDLQLDVEDFPRLTSVRSIVEHLARQGIA